MPAAIKRYDKTRKQIFECAKPWVKTPLPNNPLQLLIAEPTRAYSLAFPQLGDIV